MAALLLAACSSAMAAPPSNAGSTASPARASGSATFAPSPFIGTPAPLATGGAGGSIPPTGTSVPSAPPATGSPSPTASRIPVPVPVRPPPLPATPPPPSFALRVPILMYHRVAPASQIGRSLPSLVVDPGVFADQVAALDRAGWHTITAADLAVDLALGRRPPARTVVITFDDGYEDGYTFALPILRRHRFVATYFVVTGRFGEPGKLTRAEVRTLASAGMEVSDHTVRHLDLVALSPVAQAFEIRVAAATITGLIGSMPVTFAYPFGDLDQTTVDLVRAAGFWMAMTNHAGVLETWANRLLVPRLEVGPGLDGSGLIALLAPYRVP